MSDDHKKTDDKAKSISRRGLLGTAALAVGAATTAVTARGALARSSDIVLDSQGRVMVDGSVIREAAKKTGSGGTGPLREGHNEKCVNTGCAKSPASGGGTGTSPTAAPASKKKG